MSLSNTYAFSSHLACAPWLCQCFMVKRCHTRGFGDDKNQHLPLPALLTGGNMETESRGHNNFSFSFTVTDFDGNVCFFHYFLIIYDTAPLVCELLPLIRFWRMQEKVASLMFLSWTAFNMMNTPHMTRKKQIESFQQLLFIHFPSRCTDFIQRY